MTQEEFMRKEDSNRIVMLVVFISIVLISGCHKKVASAPAVTRPPQSPPAAPTVTLQASPPTIQKGENATLTWSSQNATQLTLSPGIGGVSTQGSTQIDPAKSTTYTITATGPGGTAEATARITVSAPIASTPSASLEQLFQQNIRDAFFDYDKSDIRSDAREALRIDAEFLRSHPEILFTIAGHCDERGSEEYNIGLGDRRAVAAKGYLVNMGIADSRIQTMSYGKERPFCTEHNESCWQQNRRGHMAMTP
jgi:peptidoglycan-associated lipoprotein